ncbi:hypothetical protein PsYK624_170830 [Phanerochaete sordida]|uniref:Uncharacterized protein n=1 Tax=Phanerochaete sordida TaxID=48140 RepID=A0A9P3LMP6_9APHY|nr:hypothetical protein PsYK624_170830 [Phanerochaete sordida]
MSDPAPQRSHTCFLSTTKVSFQPAQPAHLHLRTHARELAAVAQRTCLACIHPGKVSQNAPARTPASTPLARPERTLKPWRHAWNVARRAEIGGLAARRQNLRSKSRGLACCLRNVRLKFAGLDVCMPPCSSRLRGMSCKGSVTGRRNSWSELQTLPRCPCSVARRRSKSVVEAREPACRGTRCASEGCRRSPDVEIHGQSRGGQVAAWYAAAPAVAFTAHPTQCGLCSWQSTASRPSGLRIRGRNWRVRRAALLETLALEIRGRMFEAERADVRCGTSRLGAR